MMTGVVLGAILVADSGDEARRAGLEALHAGRPATALAHFRRHEEACRCAEGAFLVGRALLELAEPDSARAAFRRALEREAGHQAARLHLAHVLERLGQGEAAAGERRRLEEEGRRRVAPRRMTDRVNSAADDYLPHLGVDGRRLVFTSNRPGGMDGQGRGGVHREDLWTSELGADGRWQVARLLEGINTADPEGAASLSADGRLLVFSACDRPGGSGDCDLLAVGHDGRGWGAPTPLAELNSPDWDSHPALAADGSWLIFASSRPGGVGGRDLWISRRDSLGRFGPAFNPGPPLNSPGDEAGPFLHADGRSLYFSSDGHPGLGGLDLFLSRRDDQGRWGLPVNLGPPLSTEHPDLGLSLAGDGRRAVLASRREGRPDLDLYETTMPACCPAEPRWLVAGRVREEGSGRPLAARVRVEAVAAQGAGPIELLADADGRFMLILPPGEHLLFADHPGHLFACRLLPVGWRDDRRGGAEPTLAGPDSLLLDLPLLRPGAGVVLEALRFEFDCAEIRPEGWPVLARLRDLLRDQPTLGLDLHGHTDEVGSAAYNLDLSWRRAEAVKTWLVAAGIAAERVATLGLGESQPREMGRDEAARAANRRTELWLRQY